MDLHRATLAGLIRSLLIACVPLPVFAAPDVTIEDEDPAYADWSWEFLYTDSENLVEGAAVVVDVPSGGHPSGPHLKATFDVAARSCPAGESPEEPGELCWGKAWYGLIFTGDSYDPSTSGAVSSIDVSVALKASQPPLGQQVHGHSIHCYLAFKQAGVVYWRTPPVETSTWTTDGGNGDWVTGLASFDVDSASFNHVEGGLPVTGEPGPNFINGGPIEVGCMMSMASYSKAHASPPDSHGLIRNYPIAIDNFEVTLHRADIDADGDNDDSDNCVEVENADQCDTDNDGYGNLCDGDFDNDGFTLSPDFAIWEADFLGTGLDGGTGTDMDCDGYVFSPDYVIWDAQFLGSGQPGPSGLACAGTVPCP